MPANPQRVEDFCLNIVRGMRPSQAALAAGYKPGYCRSDGPSLMLKRPEVVDRIETLRAYHARRLSYDVSRIIKEIESVQERARLEGKLAVELAAISEKAAMLGLKPKEASQIDVNVTYKPSPVPTKKLDLTVDEWQELWSPKEISSGNGHG